MKFGTVSTAMCHITEAAGVVRAVFILSFYFEQLQTIFGIVFLVSEGIFLNYKHTSLWGSRLKKKESENWEHFYRLFFSPVNLRGIKKKNPNIFTNTIAHIFHF